MNREVTVTLDDVLVEDGQIAPFHVAGPTFVAMGRFGNVMLTGGDTSLDLDVQAGEVVRLYLTNTANTRLFNVALPGARMKLVGGDSGRYEHERFVEEVMLAPSERAVIDVLFDAPGTVPIEHRPPGHTYTLGTIVVAGQRVEQSIQSEFELLRTDPELTAERARIEAARKRPPDKTLAFESLMPLLYGDQDDTASTWTCPMHSDLVTTEPGTCPSCGMKLIPGGAEGAASAGHTHAHDTGDGLEWEDLMPEINRASDSENMIWKLVDRDTGKENGQIDWTFAVGDEVKIRLVNDMDQDHPMHHPFHVHGAGRFLVLTHDTRAGSEPRLEGHRSRASRRDRRHPARRLQPGTLDGPLSHRRTQPERDDVQLQRDGGRDMSVLRATTTLDRLVADAADGDEFKILRRPVAGVGLVGSCRVGCGARLRRGALGAASCTARGERRRSR